MARRSKTSADAGKKAGVRPQGRSSKEAIIQAGIEVFGRLGFESATTRMIASHAGVNLGSLQYYFRGKENLYLACAEHIVTRMEPQLITLEIRVKTQFASGGKNSKKHLAELESLWADVAALLLDRSGSDDWLVFVNREETSPGKAFDIFYDRVVARLIRIFAEPIAAILQMAKDSDEVLLNTIAFLGPIFIFQRAPSIVLKTLHWPNLNAQRLVRAKEVMLRQSIYALSSFRPSN